MNSNIKLQLLDIAEVPFVSLLLERGIVEHLKPPSLKSNKNVTNRFNKIRLTDEYMEKFDIAIVDEQWIQSFRKLFPNKRNGSVSTITIKLTRFLLEYPEYSLQNIYDTVSRYISDEMHTIGTQFIFDADNIFYKRENTKGRPERVAILKLLKKYGDSIDALKSETVGIHVISESIEELT